MTGSGGEAAHIAAGGVYLPAAVCEPLWRVLRGEIARRRADGGKVRPEIAQTLDVLRAAAQAHLTANGHTARTYADIPAACEPELLTTDDLAARLGVTPRHARRIAQREGVEPVARNVWDPTAVASLTARRSHDRTSARRP